MSVMTLFLFSEKAAKSQKHPVVRNIETLTTNTTGETEQSRLTVITPPSSPLERNQLAFGHVARIATFMTLTLNVANMIGSKHFAKVSPAA